MHRQAAALALPPPPLLVLLLLLHLHGTASGAAPLVYREYSVRFGPPTLVGQSNHADHCTTSGEVPSPPPACKVCPANGTHWGTVPCHYWFPISFLQLGTGPSAAFVLGVRRC
jgi:hypothetical protein